MQTNDKIFKSLHHCPLVFRGRNFWIKMVSFAIFFVATFAFPTAIAYATPSLQFDPNTATVVSDQTFQVQVKIQVDTNQVLSSDAIIYFAGSDLSIVSVGNGGFFPNFSSSVDASGKLELHGHTTAGGSAVTGTGVFATIVIKGLKTSGSSAISYGCVPGDTTSTNILNTTGTNILACTQLNQVGVSYAASATSTPTPTNTPGNTPTPTPTGHNTVPLCVSLANDISVSNSPVTVTFTCSGVDTDGDITAAAFTFGDGTSQTIEKNVGSPGSLTTSHTYSTIGAVRASCILRDNNQVYSSLVSNCQKIITLNRVPTPTPSPRPNSSSTLAANKIVPTQQVVSIIDETPEPTMIPIETPTPTVAGEKPVQKAGNTGWLTISGVIAVIVAFIILRRKKTPPKTDIPPITPPVTL